MIGPALLTALYLAGVDALRGAAIWDATHPGVYYASFAAALAINLLAVVEGVYRYRFNHDANERRRIRMAVYTAVPGVPAYAVKDGVPIVALLAGNDRTALLDRALRRAAGSGPAAGVRARLRGRRRARARAAGRAAPEPAVRAGAAHARRARRAPGDGLVLSLVRDRGRTVGQIFTAQRRAVLALIAILGRR